jgi:hypothetical protein
MKRPAALFPIVLAPGATAPRNKRNLRTVINADCLGLSFFASVLRIVGDTGDPCLTGIGGMSAKTMNHGAIPGTVEDGTTPTCL